MAQGADIMEPGKKIMVPSDIRPTLGVHTGDSLVFESDGSGVQVRPLRVKSRFEKYRGIGNPGIPAGRRSIARRLHELRGKP
jgi:bifunctional DNA-binding transcriptional regulator/antitoxin component of YhaV-PrlF toxin-antitoxin module